jgi:hypothetical protein
MVPADRCPGRALPGTAVSFFEAGLPPADLSESAIDCVARCRTALEFVHQMHIYEAILSKRR